MNVVKLYGHLENFAVKISWKYHPGKHVSIFLKGVAMGCYKRQNRFNQLV